MITDALIASFLFNCKNHPKAPTNMNKARQKYLFKWLRNQQKIIKKQLGLTIILATFSSLILVAQTWLLATVLQSLIMENTDRSQLLPHFAALILCFALRALILWFREKIGFQSGQQLRRHIRQQILAKIHQVGPATINHKPAGSWASIMLEQVENLHNFYARYLPQQTLSVIVPVIILIAVFPLNWAAGLILLFTAPLIPIFMILVGIAAADSNLICCCVGLDIDGDDITAVLRGSSSGRNVSCGELARPRLTLYREVLVLVGCRSVSNVLLGVILAHVAGDELVCKALNGIRKTAEIGFACLAVLEVLAGDALGVGLNVVDSGVEIGNYLSSAGKSLRGSDGVAALAAAALSVLLGRGSNSVAGSVGLSLGGLVAADGLSLAGLVVCNRLAVCGSVGLACGCVAVVLILLAGCKSKNEAESKDKSYDLLCHFSYLRKNFLHFSALIQVPFWSV